MKKWKTKARRSRAGRAQKVAWHPRPKCCCHQDREPQSRWLLAPVWGTGAKAWGRGVGAGWHAATRRALRGRTAATCRDRRTSEPGRPAWHIGTASPPGRRAPPRRALTLPRQDAFRVAASIVLPESLGFSFCHFGIGCGAHGHSLSLSLSVRRMGEGEAGGRRVPALHCGAMSLMRVRRVAKWIWVRILTAV